jgi:tetratricopeptide (TPR) repeat protein
LVFLVLILGAAGLITLKKRLPILLTTLAMLGAFLLVRSTYASQLFVVLAFPFMVLSFSAVGEYLASSFKSLLGAQKKMMQPISLVIFSLLIIFSILPVVGNCAYTRLGSASTFGLGAQENLYPSGAKILLENPLFPERAINLPEDGGYLAFKYNRKIFIDYRSGRYERELIEQLNDTLSGDRSAYDALFDAYRPEAFILNTLNPASAKGLITLLSQKVWRLVYFDGITAVLLLDKKDAAFAPLLNDPTIQKTGLDRLERIREEYAQKSLKKGCHAGNAPELIGAGKIFLALNRPEESEDLFSILLQGYKGMPGAWIGLGNSQLMLKNFDGALESLQTATKLAHKILFALRWYGTACKFAWKREEEERATKQAVQIFVYNKKKAEKKKNKELEQIPPIAPTDTVNTSIEDLVVPSE